MFTTTIMQTGVISFCDRVGFNIKTNEVKAYLLHRLESLYNIKIVQKQWFRLDEESVEHLKRSKHFLNIRSNGNPYLMFMCYYQDVPLIFYIDKKIHPGYTYPRIILGRGLFNEELFNNTLMDGEMVKKENGKWVFLINDIISYKGTILKGGLESRLEYVYKLLDNDYTEDPVCDLCQFRVKTLFPTTVKGLDELLEFSKKLPYTNRGIYFWNDLVKYKPKLHNFDDTLIKSVIRKVKDVTEFKEEASIPIIKQIERPEPNQHQQQDKSETQTLWLRKTEFPNVYDLFRTESGKNHEGVAYISSLLHSKQLRTIFKDATVATTYKYNCVYNEKFKKWQPIEQAL